MRTGLSGFGAGLSIGKALIEEQACLLNGLLSYSSNLLGSPCEWHGQQGCTGSHGCGILLIN